MRSFTNTDQKHYHVFMGAANTAPMAATTIKDYDESIRKFLSLSKSIFGREERFNTNLNYPTLLAMSGFGDAEEPMTLGTLNLCIQWCPCNYDKCMSPSWN